MKLDRPGPMMRTGILTAYVRKVRSKIQAHVDAVGQSVSTLINFAKTPVTLTMPGAQVAPIHPYLRPILMGCVLGRVRSWSAARSHIRTASRPVIPPTTAKTPVMSRPRPRPPRCLATENRVHVYLTHVNREKVCV